MGRIEIRDESLVPARGRTLQMGTRVLTAWVTKREVR